MSALGTNFDELAKNWKSEKSYKPNMTKEEREKKLELWGRALEAVKKFHSNGQ
jgi:glycerol kinase